MQVALEFLGTALPGTAVEGSPFGTTKLHCRIRVFGIPDRKSPFDEVNIQLQGVVQTQIGAKADSQAFVDITERRRWSDFESSLTFKRDSFWQGFVDISLTLPPKSTDLSHNLLLPCARISGSTYVTQSTVLSDQHRVQGSCEILYKLSADFTKNNMLIKQQISHLDIRSFSNGLKLEARTPSQAVPIEVPALLSPLSLHRISSLLSSKCKSTLPSLWLRIPNKLAIVSATDGVTKQKYHRVTLPLTLSLQGPPNLPATSTNDEILRNGLSANIIAKWRCRRVFSTTPTTYGTTAISTASAPVINQETALTQRTTLSFPPFLCPHPSSTFSTFPAPPPPPSYASPPEYTVSPTTSSSFQLSRTQPSPDQQQPQSQTTQPIYATTESLHLILPHLTLPSITTPLLTVSYSLDMQLSFKPKRDKRGTENKGEETLRFRLGPCGVRLKIPLVVGGG
jgi:hypothetical protein